MYQRDPRLSWTPAAAYHFPGTAGKPDDLLDLTPPQFDAFLAAVEKANDG